jgi:phosphatidylglycerophosphate synthase
MLASLAPALALTAYFVLGLGVFALRARRVFPADEEVARRPASRLLGRYLRHYLMWMLGPWERALVALGVAPNTLTLASLVTALGAAVALGAGRFALGGWLYLGTGILDILDGRVARASGRVTAGGAFFDSVIDRYAELVVFAGLALFYRGSWVLALVLAAAIGSVMVSYARARGEALGVDVTVGTMQRPERLFYLGLVMAMAPLAEALAGRGPLVRFPPVVIALAWLAVWSNFTAVQRIAHTLRRLDSDIRLRAPLRIKEGHEQSRSDCGPDRTWLAVRP